jgi:hypothetical protein
MERLILLDQSPMQGTGWSFTETVSNTHAHKHLTEIVRHNVMSQIMVIVKQITLNM